MGKRIWVDFDDAEYAILSKAAERVEGDVRFLISECARAASRGEIGEEVMVAIEDRMRRRCKRRNCRSGSESPIDSEQRKALLEAVGPAQPELSSDRPRRPPEPQPMCEPVAKNQRERLIRSVQQAERLRRERGGDVFSQGKSGKVWPEG